MMKEAIVNTLKVLASPTGVPLILNINELNNPTPQIGALNAHYLLKRKPNQSLNLITQNGAPATVTLGEVADLSNNGWGFEF